jgi:hypothetical protein
VGTYRFYFLAVPKGLDFLLVEMKFVIQQKGVGLR